jgi:hypothetical protein
VMEEGLLLQLLIHYMGRRRTICEEYGK